MKLHTIIDVAEGHLCTGCGACVSALPAVLEMVDATDQGRRPRLLAGHRAEETTDAVPICPGVGLSHGDAPIGANADLLDGWGPVLELWEGFATAPATRRAGSSGGVISALAADCIANQGMHGVLHITADEEIPLLNKTVLSTEPDAVLAAAGSRYAPASPCDSLHLIEDAPHPCVFIGKPCDVAALGRLRRQRPLLDAKIGLTIAIFCAGTPSLRGTLAMLREVGVTDPRTVREVRYRGEGWPGEAVVVESRHGARIEHTLSYEQSWGEILQEHRQWRCYVCADHTGEFADIAVGDPWYRPIGSGDPGRSLVLVRTERGRQAVQRAIEDGAITLERVEPGVLPASQPNLLATRGGLWGRTLALRLVGAAAPRYERMPTFKFWWALPVRKRIQSVVGTFKRVRTKRLLRRAVVVPLDRESLRPWPLSASAPQGGEPQPAGELRPAN